MTWEDEARARANAATPGPWIAEYSGEQGNCVIPANAQSTREAVAVTRLYDQQADAEFIAHAGTFRWCGSRAGGGVMSGEVVWTDAEREAVAAAHADEIYKGARTLDGEPRTWDTLHASDQRGLLHHAGLMLDALAPLVAERVRQARAEAISDLADEWQAGKGITLASQAVRATRVQERIAGSQMVLDWLRGRANAEGGQP